MNSVSLMGRLTATPELKHTPSGNAVVSFTLAVERDYVSDGSKETDFITIVAWKKTAEFVSKYFVKGQLMGLTGRLQSRKWADQNNKPRTSYEINAEHIYFADSRQDLSAFQGDAAVKPNGFMEIESDGELPF